MKAFKSIFSVLLALGAALLLPTLASAQKNVSINWSYDSVAAGVAGFRLYNNNVFLCETTDPLARQLTCPVGLAVGLNSFTLTSFDVNRMESAQSNAFKYTYVPPTTNTPPTASPLALSTQEDSSLTGLLNGNDPESQPLTYTITSNPSRGRVNLLNAATGSFVYTPNTNVNGIDTFTYVVNDSVNTSGTATVTITVSPVNDAPVALADNAVTNEDTPVVISVLTNDSDVDGNTLSVSTVRGASHGTTTITGNTVRYVPAGNYYGNDTFTYDISDGLLIASASVNIVVASVNDAPVAQNMSLTTSEDTVLSGKLNASDPENNSLRYTLISLPTLGTAAVDPSTGSFAYTPKANVNGVDSFSFKVNDGQLDSNIATASITINPANETPMAAAGPDQTVLEGDLVQLDGSNSSDPDGNISSYQWLQIDGPAVVLSDPNSIKPSFESLDLKSGNASLTFKLTVTDQAGLSSQDTSIINITWVNEPPVANAGLNQTVFEGEMITLDATLSQDPDDGIASYFWEQISGTPITLNDAYSQLPAFRAPESINMLDTALTFRLTVTDRSGLRAQDTVIINISWTNNPPVADAGADQNVYAGQTVIIDASRSLDTDDGIQSVRWTQTAGVPVTLSAPTAYKPTFNAPAIPENGVPVTLTFQVLVTDFGGLQSTDTINVVVSAKSAAMLTPQVGLTSLSTLTATSKGRWVSVYIELPTGYSVKDIDINTVVLDRINGVEIVPPLYISGPIEIGDYNRNGIPELIVKFNKQELFSLLTVGDSIITVSGELYDGTMFDQTNKVSYVK